MATALVLAATAVAPAGWQSLKNGTLRHIESGALCPLELFGLKRQRVYAPPNGPVIAVCEYQSEFKDQSDTGLVRVRYHSPNFAHSPQARQSEADLLAQKEDESPLISYFESWERTNSDGKRIIGESTTIRKGRLFIDCQHEGPPGANRAARFAQELCRFIRRSFENS